MSDLNYMQISALERLRKWIEGSPLASKCVFMDMNDINEILRDIDALLKVVMYWDDKMLQCLLVVACTLFIIYGSLGPPKHMRSLLLGVLPLLETKDPISVNGHVDYLVCELHKIEVDQPRNLFLLVESFVDARVLTVGVCLLWYIIGQIVGIEVQMHRYRQFAELTEALEKSSKLSLTEMNTSQLNELQLLLEAINMLMELVLFANNNELKWSGYPDHFFQMRRAEVDFMLGWATSILYQNNNNEQNFKKIDEQVTALVTALNRVRKEIPELVDFVKVPKLLQVEVDTYSDLDD